MRLKGILAVETLEVHLLGQFVVVILIFAMEIKNVVGIRLSPKVSLDVVILDSHVAIRALDVAETFVVRYFESITRFYANQSLAQFYDSIFVNVIHNLLGKTPLLDIEIPIGSIYHLNQ